MEIYCICKRNGLEITPDGILMNRKILIFSFVKISCSSFSVMRFFVFLMLTPVGNFLSTEILLRRDLFHVNWFEEMHSLYVVNAIGCFWNRINRVVESCKSFLPLTKHSFRLRFFFFVFAEPLCTIRNLVFLSRVETPWWGGNDRYFLCWFLVPLQWCWMLLDAPKFHYILQGFHRRVF